MQFWHILGWFFWFTIAELDIKEAYYFLSSHASGGSCAWRCWDTSGSIPSCAHSEVPSSSVGAGELYCPHVSHCDGFSLLLYDSLISELYFRESPNLLFIVSLKIDTWNFKADSTSLSVIINSSIFTIFSMHWNIIFTSFVGLAEIDLQKYRAHLKNYVFCMSNNIAY